MKEILLRFPVPPRAAEPAVRGRVIDECIAEVARILNVLPEQMRGGGRAPNQRVLLARRMVVYSLRQHADLTYRQIAEGLDAPEATIVYLFNSAERLVLAQEAAKASEAE